MSLRPGLVAAAQGGKLECAAANAAQTKLRATEGAQLRLKTNVRRNQSYDLYLTLTIIPTVMNRMVSFNRHYLLLSIILVFAASCHSPNVRLPEKNRTTHFNVDFLLVTASPAHSIDYVGAGAIEISVFRSEYESKINSMFSGVPLNAVMTQELKKRPKKFARNISILPLEQQSSIQIPKVPKIADSNRDIAYSFEEPTPSADALLIFQIDEWGYRLKFGRAYLNYTVTLYDFRSKKVLWQDSHFAADGFPLFFQQSEDLTTPEEAEKHIRVAFNDALDDIRDTFGGEP